MADTFTSSYRTREETWCRQQAKNLQNRAHYIREAWAKQAKTQAEEEARKQADGLFRQQLADITANIQVILQATQQSFQLATQSNQQSTPPTPQAAKKEEEETRPKPLYQATVVHVPESTAGKETEHQHGSSKPGSDKPERRITLSRIPRLCNTPSFGAACLSNALSFAIQHSVILVDTLPGHIQHSEGMEATGQG